MNKYMEVAKIHMKSQLIWRMDVLFQMLFTITKILFAYLLWHIIFSEKSQVMGLTFDMMMSYYLVSSCLSQLDMSQKVSEEVSQRIRNGTFSKYLVLPIHVEGYFLAMVGGLVLFYLSFVVLAGGIWIWIFRIHLIFTRDVLRLIGTMILILEGLVFMVLLNFYFGLLTLKYAGIGTFLMIKNNLMALMTGTLIPLVLFPTKVIFVMKMLPFYYVTYLPSMILTGNLKDELLQGIIKLLLWTLFLQILIVRTFCKYKKEYDGVGI